MKKTIFLTTILLCSIGFSQTPKGGEVTLRDSYDEKIFIETGKHIFNEGMKDVRLNGEVIATVEDGSLFAYSFKNGQLILAVNMYDERCTIMYTIDIESKTIKKKERLNMKDAYKGSDLELSIIGNRYDKNAAIMQYTWKGKMNKVILSEEKKFGFMHEGYISENGHLVACDHEGIYVFSMDKKEFTHLGEFDIGSSPYSYDFCFPLNEYVIYFPQQNLPQKVYLYRYAEKELYATRYMLNTDKIKDTIEIIISNMKRENMSSELSAENVYELFHISAGIERREGRKIRDSIISNMRNGNIYEQFLPLTRVENVDSMVNANSREVRNARWKKVTESSSSKKK